MRINKYNVGDVFPEHIDYKVKRNIKGEWERLFETSCKNYAD